MQNARYQILSLLQKQKQNDYISGEYISEKLKLTRAAVWKHMQALRHEGYEIEALPNRGYRLISIPDLLTPEALDHILNTQLVGKKIYYYTSLDSTNYEAHRLASRKTEEGTVIFAEEQTSGRGRRNRVWHSPPGQGIWMSILFYPTAHLPSAMSSFTAAAATMVTTALRQETSLPVTIKWPNDLMLHNKKIGGILSEIKMEPEAVHYIILGIGINVNQHKNDFPKELKSIATSLHTESGIKFKRQYLCASILKHIDRGYPLFLEKGFYPFKQNWKEYNMTLGNYVTINLGNEYTEGYASDIDDNGSLIVTDTKQVERRFSYGEIEHLRTFQE